MKYYKKKLKVTLIFFLGTFALLINLITFYMITTSMEQNHMELSRAHMEHQYQNCRQRMEVLGQQFLSLAEDAQLAVGVENGNPDQVKKKLKGFLQSAPGTLALSVYTLKEGRAEFWAGEGRIHGIRIDLDEWVESLLAEGEECLWYLPSGEEGTLHFLCRMEDGGRLFGFLLVKYELDSMMEELAGQNTYDSWDTHLAVAADTLVWTDEEAYWQEADPALWQKDYDYVTEGRSLRSSRALTENGVRLVQVVARRIDGAYFAAVLGQVLLFLASLLGICLGVNRFTANLMEPLERLKRRMEQMRGSAG